MKSNQLPWTFKMLAIVGLTLIFAYQPSDSLASGDDPCGLCEHQFFVCGGWQNDNCVNQYLRCLYKNGCPTIEPVRGESMPGMEVFAPVAGH